MLLHFVCEADIRCNNDDGSYEGSNPKSATTLASFVPIMSPIVPASQCDVRSGNYPILSTALNHLRYFSMATRAFTFLTRFFFPEDIQKDGRLACRT